MNLESVSNFNRLSLAYSVALSGNFAVIDTKHDLDILTNKLHQAGQHKGVVIAGCNPWLVSVVRE